MRLYTPILILILTAGSALAQRHKLGTVNAETPEGLLLQQIGQAQDESKKIQLMEQFASQSPKHAISKRGSPTRRSRSATNWSPWMRTTSMRRTRI